MRKNKSKYSSRRNIRVGDLVYHVLYGREWIGLVLALEKSAISSESTNHKNMALVRMLPGTKYENFFIKRMMKKANNMGYISANWLFKLEELKSEI